MSIQSKCILGIWAVLGLSLLNGCGSSTSSSTVTVVGSQSQISASVSALRFADSGIDPSSVEVKVYKIAVSENTDCTSPTTLFEESAPDYSDFSATPTLGSGSIANGTYPCVMIEMSDQVKFTPSESTDSGSCVSGTEYTIDVCGEGSSSSTLIDGTSVTCAASTDDRVAIYLSTISIALPKEPGDESDDTGNPFVAPTSSSTGDGFFLDGAFEVTDTTQGTFTVDFTSRIADEFGECGMESPNWGFQ